MVSIRVYGRLQKTVYDETQCGEERLPFFFETMAGGFLFRTIFARRWYSRLSAIKDGGHYSLNKIRSFIDQFDVDMSEYLDESLFPMRASLPE